MKEAILECLILHIYLLLLEDTVTAHH